MSSNAVLLAIGTEITSGEISNSNGAWLSERLEDLGFEVRTHVVVPDDRALILESLNWLSRDTALLVVTGGLGPTSDDFTREVLAEWQGSSLEFNEEVWQDMNRIYQERGLNIRPSHRQQCHFPADSEILHNPVGTAHGFSFRRGRMLVAVLPGPPREIEGMWEAGVRNLVLQFAPEKANDLRTWTCFGVTESEAAEVTEQVIHGSGLKVGYRASLPFVKVKLWVPRGSSDALDVVTKMEEALAPWIVARDREDTLTPLLQAWREQPFVHVVDGVTQGRLASRLAGAYAAEGWPMNLILSTGRELADESHSLTPPSFWVQGVSDDRHFELGWGLERETVALPFKLTRDSRRGIYYLCEMAILWWTKRLATRQNQGS